MPATIPEPTTPPGRSGPSRSDRSTLFLDAPFAFVPAVVTGIAAGAAVLWVVARRYTAGPPHPLRAHMLPWAQAMALPDDRDQFLYHAGLVLTALGGVAGAWIHARLLRSPDCGADAPARETTGPTPGARPLRPLLHGLVVAAVALLLYVPDYRAMTGTYFRLETFYHWHLFAIMPAHAWVQGQVPVLESFTRYGLGLPVVLGGLSRLLGEFSYAGVVWLAMTYGVVYFVALYALLWAWLKSWWWSVAGLALGLLLQQFLGLPAGRTLWEYPSSTVIRSPLDVWMFLLLTAHVTRGRPVYLFAGAIAAGAALFYETDAGLYLTAGFVAYCAYHWIDAVAARGWNARAAYTYVASLALVPVAFLLLTWLAVGGAVFMPVFWSRVVGALAVYFAGFDMLPMDGLGWSTLHFFLAPGFYVLVGVLALVATLRPGPRRWQGAPLLGALAVYGAGLYHQFVGRSHPWNWFHVCVPLVVLGTVLVRAALRRLELRLAGGAGPVLARLVPVLLAGTAVALLWATPTVRSYPGMLSGARSSADVEWALPGAGFRTVGLKAERDRLTAVARRIRETVPAHEPVAVISDSDAILYMMADRPAFSRFAPLYITVLLDSEVDEVVDALRDPKLRWVFREPTPSFPPWSTQLPPILEPVVEQNFERIDAVERFEVWRRRDAGGAAASG